MSVDLNAVRNAVNAAHAQFASISGGANASYIPYLASVPSTLSGLTVVTTAGQVVAAGDTQYEFAIELISKVFTQALALEDHGPEVLRAKVGADATGMPFNSVMALALHGGRPLSPLVNAGAMATASLVNGAGAEERWARILDMQGRMAGRTIALSEKRDHRHHGGPWLLGTTHPRQRDYAASDTSREFAPVYHDIR